MPASSAQSTSSAGQKNDGYDNGTHTAPAAAASAFLGSMLFTRCVSGTRVVPRGQAKSVGGVNFVGYGASVSDYPHDYLTAACAVGLSPGELDEFLLRLDKALRKAKEDKAFRKAKEDNAGASDNAQPAKVEGGNGSSSGKSLSKAKGDNADASDKTLRGAMGGKTFATNEEDPAAAELREGLTEEEAPVVTIANGLVKEKASNAEVRTAAAAGHHAAQEDTPCVVQKRVVQVAADSDRFGGLSASGVSGQATPEGSEAVGLEEDEDWDGVD